MRYTSKKYSVQILYTAYGISYAVSSSGRALNDEWKLISILLDCFHFPDQHTAENLRNQLLTTLQEWNISEKVHTAVTNNARNITAAIKLTLLPCLAHTLNLIVQDGMKLIQPIHKKVKRIVEYFHHVAFFHIYISYIWCNRNVLNLLLSISANLSTLFRE